MATKKLTEEQEQEALAICIEKFAAARKAANQGLEKMAVQVCAAIKLVGQVKALEAFRKAFPEIHESTWKTLIDIGEGRTRAELFMLRLSPACRNRLCRTPIAFQNTLLDGKAVNVVGYDGKTSAVTLATMSQVQLTTVVAPDGTVRSEEEQKANLSQRVRRRTEKEAAWHLVKGYLVVTETGRIKLSELRKALAK